ncbi:MAG: alpha-L-arabinofuranosidase, partial [Armatimonadetes bacterium]|nr:alpha-L-arabinofuranosidase [Armatimonadota bacterium]
RVGRVGVANEGFKGVPQRPRERPEVWMTAFQNAEGGMSVERGKRYDLSFYARAAEGFSGPLTAALESREGKVLASKRIGGLSGNWKKFSVTLTPGSTDHRARLALSANAPGTLWLDMVSLFPRETFRNRPNGLRADLMRTIAAMNPAFLRFPGGCFVEGQRMSDAWRWKETIGDIAERPGRWNLWGYRSTDGLGYHEYLQMAEDLGAEPLFVINAGMAHEDHVPMEKMGPFVQDALDAIEYANGPVTSKWGALRAKHGHPKPFGLKMIQIGNENGGPLYNERYALFHDAIRARYPNIRLIACDWGGVPRSRPLDIIDPHLYANPATFLRQANRYDTYDRTGPQVYFGEYAVTREAGTGNVQAALAEAAFMTGLERNGDVVVMSSYAPLLIRPSWKAWNPNAIVFDQSRIYGTPSYHVQTMFAGHRADRLLPLTLEAEPQAVEQPQGKIGVGTWNTQAEFRDIRVTRNGRTVFESDFTRGTEGWQLSRGKWESAGGALRQNALEENVLALAGDPGVGDFTLNLKARKLGGREGFLIAFQTPDAQTKSWWNLGGWDNTQHGMELPGMEPVRMPGRIETGRWYDIKVEVQGNTVKGYLDGQLVQQVTRTPVRTLHAVAGTDGGAGETVIKVVNAGGQPVETALRLRGAEAVAERGTALVMRASGPMEENSFASPTNVAPREETIRVPSPAFTHTFPAYSVTVLRLKAKR